MTPRESLGTRIFTWKANMPRVAAVFIVVCMTLIAASVGAVLYLSLGLSIVEASLAAVAVLAALVLYNFVSARMRDRANVSEQIADLSRGTADLARQVGELGRRIIIVETAVTRAGERMHIPRDAAAEIGELGGIVNKLAETVAAHEVALTKPKRAVSAVSAPAALPVDKNGDVTVAFDPADTAEPEAQLPNAPPPQRDRSETIAVIREAIDANRIDLYLQPVVSLPQRKVRYYEAMSRLRLANGELMLPADFLDLAHSAGLVPRLDNHLLFRCVQVVRRLIAKNREIGLFCNISMATLADPEFFPQFSEFLQANRAIAPSLILEFSQAMVRDMGPLENESLSSLSDLGFRFSLDRLVDVRLEPRDLADRGFRFVKVPGSLLLSRLAYGGSDIHAADFSDLLGRFGIDLIAEKIESEGMVVDLLDYDVRFGQGFLFSPPRPVRADALEAVAEPKDASRRPADAAAIAPTARSAPQEPATAGPASRGGDPRAARNGASRA